jgi:trehalose-phosphatase
VKEPLFDHLEEVGRRLEAAPAVALFTGYDGTLAPPADRPEEVRLDPAVRGLLEGLAGRGVLVTVLSGRPLDVLRASVALPEVWYAGNHGLEVAGPGDHRIEPAAEEHRSLIHQLAAVLNARLWHVDGAWVEDRGLSVTVHYRRAAAEAWEEIRRIVHAALAETDHPFQLTAVREAYDIRPRVTWNRDSAAQWILERAGRTGAMVFYLGDDPANEDAFAALADGVTVKVGNGAETAAGYQVGGPPDVRRFLEWLDGRLAAARGR